MPEDILVVLQERERLGSMIENDRHALAAVTRLLSTVEATLWERLRSALGR